VLTAVTIAPQKKFHADDLFDFVFKKLFHDRSRARWNITRGSEAPILLGAS